MPSMPASCTPHPIPSCRLLSALLRVIQDLQFTNMYGPSKASSSLQRQLMDNWREDRYSGVGHTIQKIEKKADKLMPNVKGSPLGQQSEQVYSWDGEIKKLRGMRETLLDFRDTLYFYSNADYGEALNEWETKIKTRVTTINMFISCCVVDGS